VPRVIISATGYTGAGGFEIYVPNEYAEEVWNRIFEAGKPFNIKPIGLGARDTLRLEMGYCLYGNDIDDTTSPLEAGLGWVTKFTKDFVNAANLKAQKEEGVQRKLVGFKMEERGIPRQPLRHPGRGGQQDWGSNFRYAVADAGRGHRPGLRQKGICPRRARLYLSTSATSP
jgi:aminomethyltransferase